jgi:uncharacterized membrane protein YphA (DoxX/SURF4 family)
MASKNANLWVSLLRIYLGAFFFYAVSSKLTYHFFKTFHYKLDFFLSHNPLAFYDFFLANVAIPHSFLFAILVVMGELVAGICLFFGFFTRFGSIVGVFLNLNYLLAMYWISPANLGINLTFIVCEIVIMMSDAGKILGVDGLLH